MQLTILMMYVVVALVIGTIVAVLMTRYGRWSVGWAVAAGAAAALVMCAGGWMPNLPQPYDGAASIAFALVIGGCFFIAMRRQGRRMRSALIACLIAFAVAGALTYPFPTLVMKLDMPVPR